MQNSSSFSESITNNPKPTKRSCWFWGGLFGCLTLVFVFIIGPITLVYLVKKNDSPSYYSVEESQISGQGENKIAVINIKGLIMTEDDSQQDVVATQEIKKMIKKATDDSSVKAVIVDINSPGGGIVASSQIYEYFTNFSKPIISVYSGEVAASGGVYVSMGTDKIISYPDTLTGSIGVIAESYDVSELLNKYGVKVNTFKSGKFKDIGSYTREMTDEEKAMMQSIIDESYNEFIKVVAKSRKLDESTVRSFADGRVFTGRQAKKLGLVDSLGTFDDAVIEAKKLAGISDARVVEYDPPFSFGSLFGLLSSKFNKVDALSILNTERGKNNLGLYYLLQ